jgi:putative phage-type endonuclease
MENQDIIQEIIKIIENYKNDNNLNYNDLTFMYHINKIRIIINNLIIKKHPKISISEIDDNYNEKYYIIAYLLFMRPYVEDIIKNIKRMDDIPSVEQRTPEWFALRNEVLSASSIYKVFGTENSKLDILLEKIGIQKQFMSSSATTHGIIFEEVSQTLYETRNSIKIKEYGCIPHESISFIGASPDGVVYEIEGIDMFNLDYENLSIKNIPKYLNVNSIALFGNLLEIKNPYSRIITNEIKNEYQKQITTQQEVCKLYKCDFLENNYTFYENQQTFLKDTFEFDSPNIQHLSFGEQNNYVKNHNLPLTNISEDGVEKGILLKFRNIDENTYKCSLFDLKTVYTKETIDKWIVNETDKFLSKKYQLDTIYYWKVKNYSLKECNFKKEEWNNIFINAKVLWDRILSERLLSDKEVLDKYRKLQALDNVVSNKKRKDTNYEQRNIEKRRKNNPWQQPMSYNF